MRVKGHCWNGSRFGREAVALISGMSSYIGAATYRINLDLEDKPRTNI